MFNNKNGSCALIYFCHSNFGIPLQMCRVSGRRSSSVSRQKSRCRPAGLMIFLSNLSPEFGAYTAIAFILSGMEDSFLII
jgi:hypothetical protein